MKQAREEGYRRSGLINNILIEPVKRIRERTLSRGGRKREREREREYDYDEGA